MKLVLYNDFLPGVLKGDKVVDISNSVANVPPHRRADVDERNNRAFRLAEGLHRTRGRRRRWRRGRQRPSPGAAARADQAPVHGRQLHGERIARAGRRPRRLPEVAELRHRPGRQPWCSPTRPHLTSTTKPSSVW